ncbi:MAG TPA: flagellin [Acidimicrobiales bacterium]|nr:flagellin [Acidimicrobiales bacterium]
MLLINDNLTALGAANNLDSTDSQLANVVGQLSSGLQIQTAADNPAGYSIAESLQSEINGYGAAISNSQNAVSVLQTAQGAMNQQESILQQMNTLATQAANSNVALNTTAASADQQEFSALVNQLDQIASSTAYAGISLLYGSAGTAGSGSITLTFQVGPTDQSNNQVTVSIQSTSSVQLSVSALSISTLASAQAAISAVQAAINNLASAAAVVGATQNQIQALANNVTVAQQNLTSAHADLVDVNVASATSQFTSLQILEQSGVSVLSQAQQLPQLALKLIG